VFLYDPPSSDPLYAQQMSIMWDPINIYPVWERGIFGEGIRVRVVRFGSEETLFVRFQLLLVSTPT
jgi:hypothetical protein